MNNFRKKIHIVGRELFDEKTNEFIPIDDGYIEFEHSLAAIADFEARTHKRFIGNRELSNEDISLYLECMCVNPDDVPKLKYLTEENIKELNDYIKDEMTATKFYKYDKTSREIVTSEKIYYWMAANRIPIEFEHWHISRLMTLLRICANSNAPAKKKSQQEIMADHARINAMNRAKYHSKG